MTINFSKLFKTAHQIAKTVREKFASYRDAFSAALKAAWEDLRGTSIVGKTRQWAFNRYNELKAAQKNARAAYKSSRTAATANAFEQASNDLHKFASELTNHCGVNGRAIKSLDFWFRTSLRGQLYDADDLIEAA